MPTAARFDKGERNRDLRQREGTSSMASRSGCPCRGGGYLAARVRAREHVSAHRRAAANKWTRRRATTNKQRLGVVEDDRDSPLRVGDFVLQTEGHNREGARWR
jgi:hypothetical protein